MKTSGRNLSSSYRPYTRFMARLMVWALIFTFILPVPVMTASANDAHVLRRLNSPERARAIEEAARIDAEARADFEQQERAAQQNPVAKAPVVQEKRETRSFASDSTNRPKSMTEVLFNGVTGFMGMPGLTGNRHDPYDPNVDQGLGFHQDGTARRADGTTGNSAASARFDGRRAASYAGQGLGYGQRGMYGNDPSGYYGAGYDPVMGINWRIGEHTYQHNNGQSRTWNGSMFDNPQQYFLQRGINYGMGWANSLGEAAFTGLFDKGRARLNFMVDTDGRINGEGDLLYPFYDGQYTTVFTQVGLRSMSGMDNDNRDGRGADRWIGNFGLGQRWYPFATLGDDGKSVDSGMWMFGYNVFFDNDFTRSHQRGGIGVEAQYDWFKIASNYYFPLSGWKGSYDFDSKFVEERPAQGWDVRVKGYLPFYRNVAVTGAYTQWYGDHVGMFSSRELEKDPRVWSYGLEYTPFPLLSAFVNQRSTERGEQDTEFGLRMTYHFNMPWDQQTSHAKVQEMRSVAASRHEFVDRENRIILEYRAKNNFHIEYLGMVGTNSFKFRLKHALDGYVAGQVVRVTAGGGVTLAEAPAPEKSFFAQVGDFIVDMFSVSTAHAADSSQTYITDRNGEFVIRLDNVTTTPVLVTVQAGNTNQNFELGATITSTLTLTQDAPQTFTVGATVNNVSFTLADSANPALVHNASVSLSWGGTGSFVTPSTTVTTDGSGKFTLNLTGQTAGTVTLTATLNGQSTSCSLTVATPVLDLSVGYNRTSFVSSDFSATATITATATDASGNNVTINNGDITWTVESSSITAAWWGNRSAGNMNGLTWGATALSLNAAQGALTTVSGTAPTGASALLTDIVGSRTVVLKAAMTINGTPTEKTINVSFGAGPLSVFKSKPEGSMNWANAGNTCGIAGDPNTPGYQASTKLPTQAQLQNIAGSGSGGKQGAAHAAGWPDDGNGSGWFYYWTGEAVGDGHYAWLVHLNDGLDDWHSVTYAVPVAVCLP